MSKTAHTNTIRSFAKLAFSLFVVAILVGSLLVTEPAKATSRFSCNLGTFGGVTRTLSCGSSAGNFVIGCGGGGCLDETGNDPNNQALADSLCSDAQDNGCPDSSGGFSLEQPPDSE